MRMTGSSVAARTGWSTTPLLSTEPSCVGLEVVAWGKTIGECIVRTSLERRWATGPCEAGSGHRGCCRRWNGHRLALTQTADDFGIRIVGEPGLHLASLRARWRDH